MTAEDVAVVRGHADAMALRLACHDDGVHRRLAPEAQAARAVFDAVEQARVEAIGSRRMAGVATPPAAQKIVDLWRSFVEEKAGASLDRLVNDIEDQKSFARDMREVLAKLDMADDSNLDPDDEDNEEQDEGDNQNDQSDQGDAEEQSSAERAEMEESEDASAELEEGAKEDADGPTGEMPDDMDETDSDNPSEASRPPPQGGQQSPGRITRRILKNSTRRSRRKTFATRMSSRACAPISTSNSIICKALSRGLPIACSAA